MGIANANGQVGWDDDKNWDTAGIALDISHDPLDLGMQILNGFNDWANLRLKGGTIAASGSSIPVALPSKTLSIELPLSLIASLRLPDEFFPPVTAI